MKKLACISAIALGACTTGNVIQVATDTYDVSANGAGFSTDGVKTDVYRAANSYCRKQLREMSEVSLKTTEGALGRNPPIAELRFKCVTKEKLTSEDTSPPKNARTAPTDNSDSYAQLKQLKELLDSGALTQKEFDTEKAKILAR